MEQETQQPPAQPVEPSPAGAPQPQKSGSKVWLWVLGGCLVIVILSMLVMGGLAWWGARKVKKAIEENQPKLEQMQKGAQDMQKNAADWQKQMEKAQQEMQKNVPQPNNNGTEGSGSTPN